MLDIMVYFVVYLGLMPQASLGFTTQIILKKVKIMLDSYTISLVYLGVGRDDTFKNG